MSGLTRIARHWPDPAVSETSRQRVAVGLRIFRVARSDFCQDIESRAGDSDVFVLGQIDDQRQRVRFDGVLTEFVDRLLAGGAALGLGAWATRADARAKPAAPEVKPGDPTPCGPALADMICIPPGQFIRGVKRGHKDEKPQQLLDMSPYFMDRFETTIEAYGECMKAGGCEKAGPNYRGFSSPRQPITGINWFQARAYCKWAGKRLPTEAEWEKAARTTDGRTYPWGEEDATCERAILDENADEGGDERDESDERDDARESDVNIISRANNFGTPAQDARSRDFTINALSTTSRTSRSSTTRAACAISRRAWSTRRCSRCPTAPPARSSCAART